MTGPNREREIAEVISEIDSMIANGRPAAAVKVAMERKLARMGGRVRYTEHDAWPDNAAEDLG